MKFLKYSALTVALLGCTAANAAIVADYNKATAATDGWSIVYQGGYGTSFDYGAVLNSIAAGSTVALASSSSVGASTFDLFAGTALNILQTITGTDTTVFADSAYWYRNSSSTGFAPVDYITQCGADATGTGVCGASEDSALSDLRLSWHGGDSAVSGGWRSGNNIWLNGDDTWQRYVLVRAEQLNNNVSEPASFAILGLGLVGLAASRRKLKAR